MCLSNNVFLMFAKSLTMVAGVIIIVICRNISSPALSAVELEDGIISMPVLDSDWSVFSLFVGKLTSFYF